MQWHEDINYKEALEAALKWHLTHKQWSARNEQLNLTIGETQCQERQIMLQKSR